jgi:hypothetical protein
MQVYWNVRATTPPHAARSCGKIRGQRGKSFVVTRPPFFQGVAAYTAACLTGESPVSGMGCLPE